MKILLALVILIAAITSTQAQTVNGQNVSEIKSEYIQIVGTGKLFSTKVKIDVDFGQYNNIWSGKDTRIIDKNGKALVLNSMIDALNFFSYHGFEFVQAYALTVGNQNVYHYLMRNSKFERSDI